MVWSIRIPLPVSGKIILRAEVTSTLAKEAA